MLPVRVAEIAFVDGGNHDHITRSATLARLDLEQNLTPFLTAQQRLSGYVVGFLPIALAGGLTLNYPAEGWALLVYLGLVPTALAYWLFLHALRTVPPTIASILTLLEPLTSAILAALIFHESLRPLGWAGAALLLGALLVLLIRR